ncbi:MAG: cyclic 2,3-diphosphoglycerate synthase [Nitrospinota bacterium]
MGAAGRDFHAFNTHFKNNPSYNVIAFTATQIPGIEKKFYPPALSGDLYPNGIPIRSEEDLTNILQEQKIDAVVFAYSDVSHEYVMHKASTVIAEGSDFWLLGTNSTMIPSKKKIVSVCAVRTGCGKSQTSRKIAQILKDWGEKIVAVRHAMPYGNLEKQKVQRYEVISDLKKHECTIEEMEEYEPYIEIGVPVYAGVDYEAILREAEKEADIIIWDGGNNDFSFFLPDLEIVVVDPHRPGDELSYFPGEVNLRRANAVIINKMDTAEKSNIQWVKNNIRKANPEAVIIEAASPISVDDPQRISGQRVLVIEDGPTLTHGGMKYGAGILAAKRFGAKEIVDPRPWLEGTLRDTFSKYPDIGPVLPAMGYGKNQMNDLQATINNADCDLVVVGTPIDLTRVLEINKPSIRVKYELSEIGKPDLEALLKPFIARN